MKRSNWITWSCLALCAIGCWPLAAQAQVTFVRTYSPVVQTVLPAPVTAYYAPAIAPVTTYYAPSAVPVTSYYAPVTTYYAPSYAPVTSYYAPAYAPVTTYYSGSVPVTTYYSGVSTLAPVYGVAPATVVYRPAYVPFQPVRNVLRGIAY